MEDTKVSALVAQYKDLLPPEKLLIFKNTVAKADDSAYEALIATPTKSPTATLLLSLFLGGIGVDRFYVGDIGKGICKLLFGWLTLGIWPFVDIFFSYKKAKEKNFQNLLMQLSF